MKYRKLTSELNKRYAILNGKVLSDNPTLEANVEKYRQTDYGQKFNDFDLFDEKTKSDFFQHPVVLNLRDNPIPEEIMSDLKPDESLVIQLSEMTVAKHLGKNTKGIKLYLHCNSIVASLIDDNDDIIQVAHKGKIIGAISNGKNFLCSNQISNSHERDIIRNKDNNPDDFDYILKNNVNSHDS